MAKRANNHRAPQVLIDRHASINRRNKPIPFKTVPKEHANSTASSNPPKITRYLGDINIPCLAPCTRLLSLSTMSRPNSSPLNEYRNTPRLQPQSANKLLRKHMTMQSCPSTKPMSNSVAYAGVYHACNSLDISTYQADKPTASIHGCQHKQTIYRPVSDESKDMSTLFTP